MNIMVLVPILVLSLLAAPFAAEAQPAGKVWRIGWLVFAPAPVPPGPLYEAFREGLRERGYLEGKNFAIERRYASPDPGRFPALAAELVAAGVDVIVALAGNPSILAAKNATTTIPIVMPYSFEPVEMGIVASLARPGGNITGLAWEGSTDIVGKKLQLFKQLVPKASRMASVWNPHFGLSRYWPPFRAAAIALGMEVYSVEFSSAEELDRALATVLKDRPSAVFFAGDLISYPRRQAICDFLLKNRFPTAVSDQIWTEAGCLISYGPDVMDMFRRTAIYVDKILKGAKPADLPIEQPTKYNLVINGKTAKALGLTIPPSLLQQAEKVIE